MTRKHELLDKDIEERIDKARLEQHEPEVNRRPIFYTVIVVLVTLAVVLSLLRYLR